MRHETSNMENSSKKRKGFMTSNLSHVACRMSHSSRRGQSLVEAVIAISILTTGFLGISTLLAKSLFLSRVVSDQITANYLAAEGIEIAKNLIDHDVFESLSPDPSYFWGKCFSFPNDDVELDYTTTDCSTLNLHPFNANDPLSFDPIHHLYYYDYDNPQGNGLVATKFTREISVSENRIPLGGPVNEITVNSIVRWDTATVTGQILRLEDHFYNWRSASST